MKISKIFCLFLIALSFSITLQAQNDNPNPYTGTETDPCQTPATTWYLGGNILAPQLYNNNSGNVTQAPNYNIFNDVGTCNNFDFILKSNNNLTMWIKPSTKVGISEANPTAKFEVLETNMLQNEANFNKLLVSIRANAGNNFQHNEWAYRSPNFADEYGWGNINLHDAISIDASFLNPANDTRTYWDRNPMTGTQEWGNGTALNLKIKPNFMQVMDQPNALNTSVFNLNVNGGSAFEIYNQAHQKINFQVAASGITNIGNQANQINSSMLNIDVIGGSAFEIFDQTNQKVNFRVMANGTTYIGEHIASSTGTHANAKLSVDGKILAREIYVNIHNSNWADYVFEKNYNLLPLKKVEEYVTKNKHLPNVPSAAELTKTDDFNLSLGEMQKIQMEKIEELYLYAIQQQKEIDKLKEENITLEKRLNKK